MYGSPGKIAGCGLTPALCGSVIISDQSLKQAGLSESEALVEIACRLFDARKLPLWPAAQLAKLTRSEFESELLLRGIDIYRIDEAYLQHELEMSRKLGEILNRE